MNHRRKLFTAMLALLVVLTLALAGCSQKGGDNGGGNNATTGGAGNEASGGNNGNTGGNAAGGDEPEQSTAPQLDPVELSIYYPGTEQKDTAAVEEEMNKQLKDKINATVKINVVDWASWAQKINLMVSSGEPFDLMFTAGWDNFSGNVAKGAFLELNDLMDKYAPETKAQIDPLYLSGTAINGKNYAVPVSKEMAHQFGVVLNKSMVDKYNFDLSTVKTLADLEPMLQTIKDNEPADVVPFWATRNVTGALPFEAIGNGQVPGAINTDAGDTKVINQFDTPEMKDLMNLMHDWNQKGFFQPDPTTQTDYNATAKAGKLFAQWQQLKPGKDAELSTSQGQELVQVELTQPGVSTGDLNGAMTAISRTSKNSERAMMLINLLNTDAKLLNTLVYGVEGKHYVKASDNIIKLPDGVAAGQSGYAPGIAYMFGNQFLDYLWDNEDPQKWQKYDEFNKSATPSPLLGFSYDAEPVKNEESAIVNIYAAYIDGLATGVMDPAKDLPEFVDKMKKAGSDKVLTEKQKQVDAFLAANTQ